MRMFFLSLIIYPLISFADIQGLWLSKTSYHGPFQNYSGQYLEIKSDVMKSISFIGQQNEVLTSPYQILNDHQISVIQKDGSKVTLEYIIRNQSLKFCFQNQCNEFTQQMSVPNFKSGKFSIPNLKMTLIRNINQATHSVVEDPTVFFPADYNNINSKIILPQLTGNVIGLTQIYLINDDPLDPKSYYLSLALYKKSVQGDSILLTDTIVKQINLNENQTISIVVDGINYEYGYRFDLQ